MTGNAALTDFGSSEPEPVAPEPTTLEDRLLEPVSTTIGLRLIDHVPATSDSDDTNRDRYLFRDEHDRWFVLHQSASASEDDHVRWVYLPEDYSVRFVRFGLKRRSVIGFDYVHRSEAPNPIRTTVTAKELTPNWGGTSYECFSCGDTFDATIDHAVHCWDEHPSTPTPGQICLEREE